MTPLFQIRDVVFEHMIEYPALSLQENEITFVRGESGCGKSTFFKLLNGIVSPSSGIILFQGTDIQKMDTIELRRRVLLVNQNAYLFEGNIMDNFTGYYKYRGENPPSKGKIQQLLSECCISFSPEQDCMNLSGGERQRIFMAICISFCPEVLLLDEPTSALDTETSRKMMQNLIRYCKEHQSTLFVISHDKGLTEEFAERVITLEGRGSQTCGEL